MAKNCYGFIPKKYPQPAYYKELFSHYNAVYYSETDREFHVEALPHYLCSNPIGARIDNFLILEQTPTHRRKIGGPFKTMKAAMEQLQKWLEK